MILWFAPGSVPLSRNQGTLESVTEDLFDRSLVGRIDAHAIEECLDLGVELDKIKRQGFLVAKLRDVATKFPPLVQKANLLSFFKHLRLDRGGTTYLPHLDSKILLSLNPSNIIYL